jgi:hypothetical protein
MVESDNDSIKYLSSNGNFVPNPNDLEHAHYWTQSIAPTNYFCVLSLFVLKLLATWFETLYFHFKSAKFKYHWSINVTIHSSPDLDITNPSGS